MLSNRSRLILPAVLGLTLASSFGGSACADYVVNVIESGGDVVATGSGTLNITGLNFDLSTFESPYIDAEVHVALFGGADIISLYGIISGPGNFSSGYGFFEANSGAGDLVGIDDNFDSDNRFLVVPENYVSGSFLNSTSTWSDATFASLGLVPGAYTWTWGSGANADSFTMNIRSVPEPASVAMLGTGMLAVVDYARRRRRAA